MFLRGAIRFIHFIYQAASNVQFFFKFVSE